MAQAITDGDGIIRAITRLDGETASILDVTESPVIISPKDTRLVHLLIGNAHTAPSGLLSKQHLGHVFTNARLLSPPFGAFIPYSSKAIRDFVKACSVCNYVFNLPFQGRFSAPRWVRSVKSEKLIFSNISIDSFGPYLKRPYHGARMSVKYYVLAILCNISKAITFQIMEDNTRASVTLALFTHSCTYRKPEMVFADRGSSQVPHTDSQEYYQYFGGHKMMTHQYTANHQNLNQVERFIVDQRI